MKTKNNNKKKRKQKNLNVLSKFTSLCWVAFILSCMRPAGHGLDTPVMFQGKNYTWTGAICDHASEGRENGMKIHVSGLKEGLV